MFQLRLLAGICSVNQWGTFRLLLLGWVESYNIFYWRGCCVRAWAAAWYGGLWVGAVADVKDTCTGDGFALRWCGVGHHVTLLSSC